MGQQNSFQVIEYLNAREKNFLFGKFLIWGENTFKTSKPRYVPDYTRAHPLTWGRGAGCDFATKSCLELSEQAALLDVPSPFCNSLMADSERTFCTSDKSSVGSCNLVMYNEPLPSIYQNFQSIEGVSGQDISKVD